jgi:hypothetical protein
MTMSISDARQLRALYNPPYARLLSLVGVVPYSPGAQVIYLLAAIVPCLLGALLAWTVGDSPRLFLSYWLRLNFSAMLFGAFVLMNFIHSETLAQFRHFTILASTSDNRNVVNHGYFRIFTSRWQYVCYVVTGLAGTLTGVVLGLPFHGLVYWYIVVWAFVTMSCVAWGFWYTLSLWAFLFDIGDLDDNVSVNPLEPRYSVGLLEVGHLSSSWSLCIAVEGTLAYVGLIATRWMSSPTLILRFKLFWLFVLIVIAVLNWIVPSITVNRLVGRIKARSAHQLQEIVTQLWKRLVKTPEERPTIGAELNYYFDLSKQLREHSAAQLDRATMVRFIGSVLIPLVLYLRESKAVLGAISRLFGGGP